MAQNILAFDDFTRRSKRTPTDITTVVTTQADSTFAPGISLTFQNAFKRGSDGVNFIEEVFTYSTTLTGNTTALASPLTFAIANYRGIEVSYTVIDTSNQNARLGTLRVVTDGTTAALVDNFAETADAGVVWNVAVVGANVEVSYTTTANNKTLRSDVKRFPV